MQKNPRKSPAKLSEDKLTIEYNRDEFSDTLPHLTEELSDQDHPGRIPISEVGFDDLKPNDPNCESFIQRCSNVEDAFEIINFLEKREEISEENAQNYRVRLKKKGLKDFGPHRASGYYEKVHRRNKKIPQLANLENLE